MDLDDMSSDLSSVGSRSPTPVDFYVCHSYTTPPGSQDTDGCSTPSNGSEVNLAARTDDMPPARKRQKTEPKPRTTQHLDLRSRSDLTQTQKDPLELLIKSLRKRRKIVVIAGAGISVSAGIPDFRSSGGLFKSLKAEHKLKASGKQLFDASVYKNDDSTSSFHDMVRSLSSLAASAKPTAFHHLLARLAQEGRLLRLYTQNVDGIDTSLPPLATTVPLNVKGPWPRTIQLHGGLEKMVCQKCSHTSDFEAPLFQGPHPPPCGTCTENDSVRDVAGKRSHGVGKLRPRIVLYNEYNPDEEAIGSVVTSDLRSRPDALIVVGTSLKIPGVRRIVREMCGVVRGRKHGVTIWINNDMAPTGKEFEDCWDLMITGESDEVARHADLRKWNDDGVDTFDECTASEVERVKEIHGVPSVVVMTPNKKTTCPDIRTPRSMSPDVDQAANKKKNPASKGRSIANVLGKEKNLAGKPKVTKNPRKKVTSSKVPPRLNLAVTKALKSEMIKPKDQNFDVSSKPMVPLSPQASRNNPLFPNLANLVQRESHSPPWKDTGIVSPTGRVPSGMAKLLL